MKILLQSARYLPVVILVTLAHAQTLPIDNQEKSDLLEAAIEAIEKAQDSSDREDKTNELEEGQESLQRRSAEVTEQALKRVQELIESGELKAAGGQALDALSKTTEKEVVSDPSENILGASPTKARRVVTEKNEDIAVEATTMSTAGAGANRVIVFEGDVVVTHPRFKLTCDRLDVFHREDTTIERTIATGRMVTINTTNNDGDPVDAKCQLAVYEGDLITLRRSPEIRSPRGLMRAISEKTYMTYDTGTNRFNVHGGPFKIDGKDPLEVEEEVAE